MNYAMYLPRCVHISICLAQTALARQFLLRVTHACRWLFSTSITNSGFRVAGQAMLFVFCSKWLLYFDVYVRITLVMQSAAATEASCSSSLVAIQ